MRLDEFIPRVLPAPWRELAPDSRLPGIRIFENVWGLRVLAGVEDRGRATGWWLHVSMSRAARLPSWDDVREVKDLFIGRDRCALHLLPPEAFYVNLHPYTLHLWSRIDESSVPVGLYEDM